MKINISTIENETILSEVKASAASGIIGGETNATVFWNSQTAGKTSGQVLDVKEFYVLPKATNLKFNWTGWS